MKKLLPSVALAFTSIVAFAASANAGHVFGLFTGCGCCSACGGTITLRQYNAFSPVACGSMMFQGCVVAPPPNYPPYSYAGNDGIIGGDCGDGSCGAGVPVGQVPAGMNGGAFSYPNAAYTYGPTMQMPAMQMPAMAQQMPMMQMPAMAQQMPVMQQMPVGYPVAPVQGAQPAAVRLP